MQEEIQQWQQIADACEPFQGKVADLPLGVVADVSEEK
jgi:hypothetical protein